MKQVSYFSFTEKLSHSVISEICLAYLLQFNTCETLDINLDVSFPLASYAAEYWITHLQSGCKNKFQSSSVFALMMKLLTDEGSAFINWVQVYDIDGCYMDLQKQRADIARPLYYASLAGLTEALYALLQMKADVNAQGGWCGNALQAAASEGHFDIAKLLIEKGANVNTWGGNYGSALAAASYRGQEAIAKLLIEKGADIYAQRGYNGDSLDAASFHGHEKPLIEKREDENAQGGWAKALYGPSYESYEAITKLQGQKRLYIAADGGYHGNALYAASY